MPLNGQFEVAGNSETGWDFTNTQSSVVSYTFTPSGTWASDVNNPNLMACTAEGFVTLHPMIQEGIKQGWPDFQKYMKYPNNNPYGLVAQNLTTNAVTDIGKKATIVLNPGETLRFVLNDFFWDYGNNSGSIKVNWSAIDLVPKVMQFDGDADYITLPAMNVNYAGGLTVEAWAWYDGFQQYSRIIDFGNGAASDNILLCNSGTTHNLRMDIYLAGKNSIITAPSSLELGKWMHLAATIDTSGNAALYKNGILLLTGKLVLPSNVNRTKNYLGKSNWLSGDRDFKGKMAEVRIWNKARTQQEIQAAMSIRLTGKEPSLVACWPLNEVRTEGSTLKVSDLTNNFSGTVTGAILVEDNTFPIR